MTYLLDTCIISKLRKIKQKPDKKLEQWVSQHTTDNYYLSTITIGEIQQGISKLTDKKQQRILQNWLFGKVLPEFEERIIDVDTDVSLKWGEIQGINKKNGFTLPSIDSLIAATAIAHNLIVVTHNISDFDNIKGLKVFNPWE